MSFKSKRSSAVSSKSVKVIKLYGIGSKKYVKPFKADGGQEKTND